MSTLKTNNIEHLDASTPSIQTTIGGGTILAGVSTVSGALNVGSGTSISSPATNVLTLGTNNVERLRVKSNGNVGIGTDNPTDKLQVQGTITATANVDVPSGDIYCGGDAASGSESGIRMRSAGFISASRSSGFIWKGYTTGTSDATSIIGSDGSAQFTELLVGTNNAISIYYGNAPVQVYGTGDRMMSLLYTQANASGPMLNFTKSRSTNDGAGAIVNSGDLLGAINFIGDDGNDFKQAGGEIRCKVDGTPGSNDMPGRLEFLTTSDGSQFPTERLRIDSDGKVNVNQSNGNVGSKFNIFNGSDTTNILGITGADESSEYAAIGVNGGNAVITGGGSGSTSTGIVFRTSASGTEAERVRITSAGEVQIANGNLKFSTAGTGIDFSATSDGSGTATSELLDDYEEGTWIPVYEGQSSAGSYTYTDQIGTYVKIGSLVTVNYRLTNITTSSAGTGSLVIGGLPFTGAGGDGQSGGNLRMDSFNIVADAVNLALNINSNGNGLTIYVTRDNLSDVAVSVTNKTSDSADIVGQFSYFT